MGSIYLSQARRGLIPINFKVAIMAVADKARAEQQDREAGREGAGQAEAGAADRGSVDVEAVVDGVTTGDGVLHGASGQRR